MSEVNQDVQFLETDDLDATKRKLRILQDEVTRLSRVLALAVGESGILDFGQMATETSATPGAFPLPALASSYLSITVNGIPGRIPVFLP